MRGSPKHRFWAKVDKSEDCWLWTGSKGPQGYGFIGVGGVVLRAHRFAWELANGPIPKGTGYHGVCVLHRCDNPKCVRPDHLFLGTQTENIRDMNAKGRSVVPNSLKTHCKRGHPLSGANLRAHKNGSRQCKECQHLRAIGALS